MWQLAACFTLPVNSMAALHYFAYGSNLHPCWLRSRVPSAQAVRKVTLDCWRLLFNKQSHVDGSAKCNILETGKVDDRVHGVIYRINTAEKAALDVAESGYDCIEMYVPEFGEAIVYLAGVDSINNNLQPYTWYRDIVIAGATLHELPQQYISRIKTFAAIPDPDAARENAHRSIVWTETE